MNPDRRTPIESWILFVAYAMVASLWETSKLPPGWPTEAITAASLLTVLYFLFTARDLQKTELWARIWVVMFAALEVVLSITLLLRCQDICVLVS